MIDAHLSGKEIQTNNIKNSIIGGQTGVEGVRFCLAEEINGEDMTSALWSWFLVFENIEGTGESVALTPVYENGLVKLPWVPGVTATQVSGKLEIQIFATQSSGGEVVKRWVSKREIVYVQEAVNPTQIIPTTPTILEQYLTTFTSLKVDSEANALNAQTAKTASEQARDDAQASATSANNAASAASTSETNATTKAAEANNSAATAEGSSIAAEASATDAFNSASVASDKAAEALASEEGSAVSAGEALASKEAAESAAVEATNKASEASAAALALDSSLLQISDHETRVSRLEGRAPKIYGFKKHKETGVVTPLYDSVDLGPIPVIRGSRPVDFINPYKDINIFYWRSCLMNTKQQVLAYYGQPGYETPSASDSYEVQIPKAYINIWEDDDYSYKIVSESQAMEGMFVPGCFRDPEGNEMPYAFVDKFRRGTVNGVSVSRPDVLPDVSQTMLQFETKAEAIDDTMLWTGNPEELDWYITLISQIMALSTDTQAYYGKGMSEMPYSGSDLIVTASVDSNNIIVSNSTGDRFKPTMNVSVGSSLGSATSFTDRTIQSITDNGNGNSTIVVDGDSFSTTVGDVIYAHRQQTLSSEVNEIGEDCGFYVHNGRSESQVENFINGIAGNGGNVYEFSFGILRYDNQPYLCHDRRELKHNDDPRNNPAYKPCGYVFEQESGSYTYIKNMKLVGDKPYCFEWVSEGGAGSTTHYADPAYYLTADYRGTKDVFRRFYWRYGSYCGRVGLSGSYSLSHSTWNIGWRSSPSLLFK